MKVDDLHTTSSVEEEGRRSHHHPVDPVEEDSRLVEEVADHSPVAVAEEDRHTRLAAGHNPAVEEEPHTRLAVVHNPAAEEDRRSHLAAGHIPAAEEDHRSPRHIDPEVVRHSRPVVGRRNYLEELTTAHPLSHMTSRYYQARA
jgi:hypothetical protein